MKKALLIFLCSLFSTLQAHAEFLDAQFYRDLAKAPALHIDDSILGQADPAFSFASRDILDSKMELRSVRDSAALQTILDKTLIKIFASRTGTVFCSIYGTNAAQIQTSVAVSATAAMEISRLCAKSFPEANGRYAKPFPKSYYFATNIPSNAPFYSWTSFSNDTFIFFEERISDEEFTARLVHELAVAADAKILMATATVESIAGNYGYKMKNGFMASSDSVRETVGAMPFPVLKFAGVTLRAMVMEAAIIEEIFGKAGLYKLKNPEVFSMLKSGQNEKAFRFIAKQLLPLQDYILPVEYSIVPPDQRRTMVAAMGQALYLNEKIVDMAVDGIVKSKITFSASHGTYSLLDWILMPLLGPESSFYSRGPRPRIGPGWSSKSDRSDVIQYERSAK